MSLVDLELANGFEVPESPERLIANNAGLAAFLNDLNRPIGQLAPDQVAQCVLAAEITDSQRELIKCIGSVASLTASQQSRQYGIRLKHGFTEFGDRLFSRIGPRTDLAGHHHVDNLIIADGQFAIGHAHIFRNIIRPEGVEQVEKSIKPLTSLGIDGFNVLHRQWNTYQQIRQLNGTSV